MLLYAQQVGETRDGARVAVFDVQSTTEHDEIVAIARPGPNQIPSDDGAGVRSKAPARRAGASMLALSFKSEPWRGPREGSWYDIPTSAIRGFEYVPVSPLAAGATYLRGRAVSRSVLDFPAHLATPRFAPLPIGAPELSRINGAATKKLLVVDCGHGNWNEVVTDDIRIIYDVGAGRDFTKSRVRKLVRGRNLDTEGRPVYVFISHWDVDHYQALLEFRPQDLKSIKAIYAPSQVPDTATFKAVKEKLDGAAVPFKAVRPAEKLPNTGKTIDLCEIESAHGVRIFRATPGGSRNQTGIVLGVEGASVFAVLTGDHHYQKVLQVLHKHTLPSMCVLVAPHHGGPAGDLVTANWLTKFSKMSAALSAGKNQWGHPLPQVVKALSTAAASGGLHRTDKSGTLSFML